MLVGCVRACADAGHPFVHERRRVRHRAHDRNSRRDPRFDQRRRDRGGDREDGLVRRQQAADLSEQDVEILWLDGDDNEPGAGNRLCVGQRPAYAVALRELVDALLAATGDDDVARLTPTGAEQAREQRLPDLPGAEDGDLPHGHVASLRAERLLVDRECGLVAEDEARVVDFRMLVQRSSRRLDRDRRGELHGIAVRAGRDRRECDRAYSEFCRELDRAPVAGREQLLFARLAAAPDRTDGVQNVPRGEAARPGRLDVPGWQPPSSRHSARIDGPPARWMAPSTPPPPSSVEFAALTIASTSCSVMSPTTSSITALWA